MEKSGCHFFYAQFASAHAFLWIGPKYSGNDNEMLYQQAHEKLQKVKSGRKKWQPIFLMIVMTVDPKNANSLIVTRKSSQITIPSTLHN